MFRLDLNVPNHYTSKYPDKCHQLQEKIIDVPQLDIMGLFVIPLIVFLLSLITCKDLPILRLAMNDLSLILFFFKNRRIYEA